MKEIKKFWTWFQDNEEALKNAFLLGINADVVFHHFERNFFYISKRIGYNMISNDNGKIIILFTAGGYSKLFPKIAALEDLAPQLVYFKPEAFIKPIQDFTPYLEGKDNTYVHDNYSLKISNYYFSILDFNINAKQLKINIYIPNYENLKHFSDFEDDMKFVVMRVIGEIAFRKHIKSIEYEQLPKNEKGLLKLIELQQYIDYLYKINSRFKTRQI
jgi:hypothetical protein